MNIYNNVNFGQKSPSPAHKSQRAMLARVDPDAKSSSMRYERSVCHQNDDT